MSPQPLDPVILRAARIRRGMTQSEVARAVGVAGGERVSKWELGTASPSASVRVRLARILELEVEELLPSLGAAGLRRLRVEAGLTVRELAARGGVSVATIKRWESGAGGSAVRAPLERLAAALGVDVECVNEAIEMSRTRDR